MLPIFYFYLYVESFVLQHTNISIRRPPLPILNFFKSYLFSEKFQKNLMFFQKNFAIAKIRLDQKASFGYVTSIDSTEAVNEN